MIPRKRILNLWMKKYQQLSDEDQDKFLNRPEIEFLSRQDEELVTKAIEQHRRLIDITQFVKDEVRPDEAFSHPTTRPDSRPTHPSATCPSCDASLVLKENSVNGNHFWGCPNFTYDSRDCRVSINIPRAEQLRILEKYEIHY